MSVLPLFQAYQIGECQSQFFRNIVEHQRILRLAATKKYLQYDNVTSISSMQLDPIDFQYLIASGADKKISIYDTWARSEQSNLEIPQVGFVYRNTKHQHKKTINCVQWYPHDTGLFVTSAFDGMIKIWDTNRMKLVETMEIKHAIYHHHMSPISTNHSLIAAASSIHARLSDMRTGSTAHILKGHRGNVLYVQWSPKDEFVLATASEDNKVLMWDVRQAKAILRNLDLHNDGTAHTGCVNSLQFNEDGRYLLSFGTDERLRLWNTDTGVNTLVNYGRVDNASVHRPLHMAIHHSGCLSSAVFVPAGRNVALFDLHSGTLLRRLSEHFSDVRCCEFNPNTQELFTAAQMSKILIWAPETHDTLCGQEDDTEARNGNRSPDDVSRLMQDTWSDSD